MRFHQRFLALFAQLTPSSSSPADSSSSSSKDHPNANIASTEVNSLLPSPPIAACSSGWSFNETWLGGAGGDQSIVTKVSWRFLSFFLVG